jgi:hypothetical protein
MAATLPTSYEVRLYTQIMEVASSGGVERQVQVEFRAEMARRG